MAKNNGWGHSRKIVKDDQPLEYLGYVINVHNSSSSFEARINDKLVFLPMKECKFADADDNQHVITMPKWMAKAKGLL